MPHGLREGEYRHRIDRDLDQRRDRRHDIDLISRHAYELLSDCGAVIVDLGGVDFMALDGLGALVALNNQCVVPAPLWR